MNVLEATMECSWVEDRLVALQDEELSPGERTFVVEHLATCAQCTEMELALAGATPMDDLVVPPHIQALLESTVDDAMDQVFAHPEPRHATTSGTSWTRWLRRDRDLSNGAMLSYGFLLAACLGWGLSNWFAVQALQEEQPMSTFAVDRADAPLSDGHIAPDQYRPASWTSEERSEPWR